jgi:hypothetical protein
VHCCVSQALFPNRRPQAPEAALFLLQFNSSPTQRCTCKIALCSTDKTYRSANRRAHGRKSNFAFRRVRIFFCLVPKGRESSVREGGPTGLQPQDELLFPFLTTDGGLTGLQPQDELPAWRGGPPPPLAPSPPGNIRNQNAGWVGGQKRELK